MTCGWESLLCLRCNKRIIAPRLLEYWIKERSVYLVWTFQFGELFKQTAEHFASQSFTLHFCNMKNESEHVPIWNVPNVCLLRRDSRRGRGSRDPRSCGDKREALFHKMRRLKSRALPATAIASLSRSLCLNIAAGPGLRRLGPWRRVEETDGGSSSEVNRDKACGGGSGGGGGGGDSGEMPGQRTSKQCLEIVGSLVAAVC